MKNVIHSFILLFFSLYSTAQIEVTVRLMNTKGQAMRNIEVSALNESANDLVKGTTDNTGRAKLLVGEPGVYTFSYLNQTIDRTYEVKAGLHGTYSMTVTYDPEGVFAPKPKADRSTMDFKTLSATQLKDKPGIMNLTIRVVTPKEKVVPGTEVVLVSVSDGFKMKGRSNAGGEASFYVPVNKTYEVDVDGNEALKTIETPNMPGRRMIQFVFYEKLRITEIAKGDTIIQKNITQENGTNTHLLFNLKVLNYDGVPLEDEPVYLQAEGGSRVYETATNSQGECKLMLQKNANYILNLKYEQGLQLVEAKNVTGFGRESLTRRYRGSAEIERIIREQEEQMRRIKEAEELAKMEKAERKKKEKELCLNFYNQKLVPTFNETPVETATQPVNYLTKTSDGYSIQFKSSGPIGTPTVINDRMYIPAGFYSPNFYCLDANNGSYKWGVELGESGASPAVYHDGVILINTYSCTLYALDAATGKLLWSKWLAGTVYSTPTADGNKVYVVFRYGGSYVLSCFDLRTGAFKWINRVDSETIACPVVEGSEVHVASQSGYYYIFDKNTGKPIEVITSIDAVSSPTITEKSIFLTANIEGKDRLVEIDRSTNKVKKTYDSEIRPITVHDAEGCQGQMNYNGSHPIVYKNKYVVLADQGRLQVFDMTTESVLWEKRVEISTSQVPIVADGKIILATSDGSVVSYDIATGLSRPIKKTTNEIDAQPVYHKGVLFIVSQGVLTAIRSVQNFKWNQWNKDASHNLRID